MKKMIVALALATSVMAGSAMAQDHSVDEMTEGLSMLELAAQRQLDQIGVNDVDLMSLTLNQLAQIKTVLEESSSSVNDKARQARAIIER